jgi:hypothetical protein
MKAATAAGARTEKCRTGAFFAAPAAVDACANLL